MTNNFEIPQSSWFGRRLPSVRSAARQRAIVHLIAVGIEQNIPLAPLLAHWAQDQRGRQRERLVRLVTLLNEGQSLPDAIEAIPGIVADEDLLALRFDAQTGTRTRAVRSTLASFEKNAVYRRGRWLAYVFTVVPLMAFILAWIQNVPMPALFRTFDDFGMASSTLQLSKELHGWTRFLGWAGPLMLLVVLLLLFATLSGRRIRRTMLVRPAGAVRRSRIAEVLQKFAVAIDAGRPIAGAVSTLARYHYDPVIRRQLLFVRNEMEQGAETWRSLAAVGMLTPAEADLLRSYDDSPDRVWLLQQLVDAKQRRAARQSQRAGELVMPIIVMLLACIVLLQALSVFQPLTQIIEGLS